MPYFNKDFSKFFNELEKNNTKEWFDDNRKRYEENVKNPFKTLVEDILAELPKIDSSINMQAKDAIFRINRDIRFSKDKTPYNAMVKAGFAKGGRKSIYAGFYLGISSKLLYIGGGSMCSGDKKQLDLIREAIDYNPKAFNKLVTSKAFKNSFGEVQGEKYKRVPKGYEHLAENTPLIFNKQFYYMGEHSKDLITSDDLLKTIVKHFKEGHKFNSFINKALDY